MSVKHWIKSKRNHILTTTMILAMMLTCMGCGVQKTDGKSLREQGMDIIQVMEEMVKSEDYGNLMSDSADLARSAGSWRPGTIPLPQRSMKCPFPLSGTYWLLPENRKTPMTSRMP